jgi:hypothetical protein
MKINNLHQLRREKKKLTEECKSYEEQIKEHFNYIQENAGTLVIEGLIETVPRINIIKIASRAFNRYAERAASDDKSGSGFIRKVLPLGIAFGMRYFKKLMKK